MRWLTDRLVRLLFPRRHRRQAIVAAEFPAAWDRILRARSRHYQRLPVEYRQEFRRQVQIFLAEQKLTGIETGLTEETRLLVAASAVTLSVGWPEYTWDELTEVLLYPQNFGDDYAFENPNRSGQAHPWGVIILTVPDLVRGFETTDEDNHHLGIHEFAHLLDLEHVHFDGIPPFLSDHGARLWLEILEQEHKRLEQGHSELNPYGLSNRSELFAVAVEAFFQIPGAIHASHSALYEFLATYFRQDPARWAKASAPASHNDEWPRSDTIH